MDARTALLPVLFIVLECACGHTAQQSGNAAQDASVDGTLAQDAGDAGDSDDGGGAGALDDASPPIRCAITGSSELTGSQPCAQSVTETCDDGNEYTVSCSCPAATCSCVRGARDAGRIFATTPYGGCPTCADASAAAMFGGCGVPH